MWQSVWIIQITKFCSTMTPDAINTLPSAIFTPDILFSIMFIVFKISSKHDKVISLFHLATHFCSWVAKDFDVIYRSLMLMENINLTLTKRFAAVISLKYCRYGIQSSNQPTDFPWNKFDYITFYTCTIVHVQLK